MNQEDWISLHVFYASDSNPMLADCVRPLVADLREAGLLRRWFFIKYWMEGPHVRLRLYPSSPAVAGELERTATEGIERFLRRRPSLYEADPDETADLYKRMFLAEYSEEEWDERYGEDGSMAFRPNNSIAAIPYEPELDRYGGPVGMELAQWHFEKSSDVVVQLLSTANVHVRTVMLGLSVQLSLALCYAFLDDDEAIGRFLHQYQDFWETSYQEHSDDYHPSFDKSFGRMQEDLGERVAVVRRAALEPVSQPLTPLEEHWITHARELRERVEALQARGELRFRPRDGSGGQPRQLDDPEVVKTILLSSYVHMTNNRLGVSILDEIYLSYILQRALGTREPASVSE